MFLRILWEDYSISLNYKYSFSLLKGKAVFVYIGNFYVLAVPNIQFINKMKHLICVLFFVMISLGSFAQEKSLL
nr:MAG TPA: hypothetical protein [Caudoviricetes sp.]